MAQRTKYKYIIVSPRNSPQMARRRRDRSEVSCVIKYLVFGFNVIFWLLGGLMLGIGMWAWSEKDMFSNISQLTQVRLDPALILIIVGAVIFIIGFTGCVGALRENTILLLFYCVAVGMIFFLELVFWALVFAYKDWFSVCVGVVFFVQLGFAIFLFMQRQWVKDQIQGQMKTMIVNYREDPDLQNLIDWVQGDWLKCCGVVDYHDWKSNIYFNCSSPSREACGVPFSCCHPVPGDQLTNWQCGYDARNTKVVPQPADVIYTEGCMSAGEKWFNQNLIPVAGVFVAIALVQILGICFAQNLRSDIFAQRAKWQ